MDTPQSEVPQAPLPTRKVLKPAELLIPIAILIAGLLIASAVYVVRIKHQVTHGSGTPEAVRPVSPSDHIIGNPTAPIVIIEYADIDSSYSKSLQLTMEQLMTEYADGGKVAWVFRHFPLSLQHPNAGQHALAAECAASLSVPTTFFRFIDAMQAAAPNQNQYNPVGYPTLVAQFGIDQTAFKKCMTDAAFEKKIHDDYDNALASGAIGSPFVVLITPDNTPAPINGALPYTSMKKVIEEAIKKLPQ
ncbi:MAG: thioredoxin domain-containing protein [Patescibacteria group bacterium]